MILNRQDLLLQLEDRLAGRISAETIADWALERFYGIEQGTYQVAENDAALISQLLDHMMFADTPSFTLDEAALRQMIARLQAL